jgi:trans-aconitate methyltransferase
MPSQHTLTPADFEQMWGEQLTPYVIDKINEYGFIYEDISQEKRDAIIKKIVEFLLSDFVVFAGEHRHEQWEKGWGENLDDLNEKKAVEAVNPHYFGKYDILRLNQKFIRPVSQNFEKNSLSIILDWLADKYMRDAGAIYEFGCGTGHHLLNIRKINPDANIYGLDWATSSQKIIQKLATDIPDSKLFAEQFDFFNPDIGFKLENNSIIYTVAALEQTGDRFEKFIDYLLENRPKLCIHIEPIGELLDRNNLLDYLSIEYFKKRKYLNGFVDYLHKLKNENKIEIIKEQRSYIGSLYIDGYSVVIWKPEIA